jgi:hypothetical protein
MSSTITTDWGVTCPRCYHLIAEHGIAVSGISGCIHCECDYQPAVTVRETSGAAIRLPILLALALLAVWAIASGLLERMVKAAVGCCWS